MRRATVELILQLSQAPHLFPIQLSQKVAQNFVSFVAFHHKLQLRLGYFMSQRRKDFPPGPLVRRMAVHDYTVQIENDSL
jgi:hypothetical protein